MLHLDTLPRLVQVIVLSVAGFEFLTLNQLYDFYYCVLCKFSSFFLYKLDEPLQRLKLLQNKLLRLLQKV